jgi:hypothetical protein
MALVQKTPTPSVDYINDRKEPSLMNYFSSKNNKNFIYHYFQ